MEQVCKKRPIIIGYEHHNTLSVIRCFGHEGITADVILCGSCNNYISKSCYLVKLLHIKSPSELSNALLNNFVDSEKRLIISCSDLLSAELELCSDIIREYFYFSHCEVKGQLTYFMNKEIQLKLAAEVGFNIPETYYRDNSKYPCLIKPVESINGGKHIFVANCKQELETFLCRDNDKNKYIIEQYLHKDREIVLPGLSIGEDVVIPGYIEKKREITGSTTFSKVCSLHSLPIELVEHAIDYIHKVKYTGLFGFEFIQVGNMYYFIELNLRNDATTYSFVYGGVNLPFIYYQYIYNLNTIVEKQLKKTNYLSIAEYLDFIFVTTHQLSLRKWLSDSKKASCHYFLDTIDKMPYRKIRRSMIESYVVSVLSRVKHTVFKS